METFLDATDVARLDIKNTVLYHNSENRVRCNARNIVPNQSNIIYVAVTISLKKILTL